MSDVTPHEAAREDMARALYEYQWKRWNPVDLVEMPEWESLRVSRRNNWRHASRGEIDAALTAIRPHIADSWRVLSDHSFIPVNHSSIGSEDHCLCGFRPRGWRAWAEHAANAIAATVCGEDRNG